MRVTRLEEINERSSFISLTHLTNSLYAKTISPSKEGVHGTCIEKNQRTFITSFSTIANTDSFSVGLTKARPVNLLNAGSTQYLSVK